MDCGHLGSACRLKGSYYVLCIINNKVIDSPLSRSFQVLICDRYKISNNFTPRLIKVKQNLLQLYL